MQIQKLNQKLREEFNEISVNKILKIFLLFFLTTNCSLDNKTGFWSKPEKINKNKDYIVEELFKDKKYLNKEFNPNLKIKLKENLSKNSFLNNLTNNNGIIDYDGKLKTISRFKYSKIDNFNKLEPNVIFDKKNLIFFDNKGTLLKFNQSSKLIWKKNYYNKGERKLKPLLNLAKQNNYLIVADDLAKYYAINIENGNLLWMKRNIAPFNSQIKIYNNYFFVIDLENTLRCYSIKDGSELWNVKTESSFIKSQKKLSLIISDKKVVFNNSIGDVSAVNISTGKLLWQTPTQDSTIYENSFNLKTSDLIVANKSVLFSNNNSEFYSINIDTGVLIWQQKINSTVRPTVVGNLIFTITNEGFLIIIEQKNGNIIRITNIYRNIKEKKRSKVLPIGFVVGMKSIYLTTSNGRLIVIDSETGKPNLMIKIDNEKISRPFILDDNLFIIKDSAIIKLD